MGWGDWRVPEITEEVEFTLKVQDLEMRKLFKRDPQAVLFQALVLAREKAGRRIMELEVAAALGPAEGRSEGRQTRPGYWRPWGSRLWS